MYTHGHPKGGGGGRPTGRYIDLFFRLSQMYIQVGSKSIQKKKPNLRLQKKKPGLQGVEIIRPLCLCLCLCTARLHLDSLKGDLVFVHDWLLITGRKRGNAAGCNGTGI